MNNSQSSQTFVKQVCDVSQDGDSVASQTPRTGVDIIGLRICGKCQLDNSHIAAHSKTRSSRSFKRDWSSCAKCQMWFHNTCVNLTKKLSAAMPNWNCPFCKDLNEINDRSQRDTDFHRFESDEQGTKTTVEANSLKIIFDHLSYIKTIERIPKGARAQASKLFSDVILDVISSDSVSSWEALFAFPFCLRKPIYDSKTSLTFKIKVQIEDFERWRSSVPREDVGNLFSRSENNRHTSLQHKKKPNGDKMSNSDAHLSKLISKKIENFDVKGAARLASTPDRISFITEDVRKILSSKHPCRSQPEKALPGKENNSISFDTLQVSRAILSFNSGSAAGPDQLSPSHLKDMIAHENGKAKDLLVHVTSLVNQIVGGDVPSEVRPFFFGAKLIALQKPNGDIRPIATGLTLRRLCSKLCARSGAEKLGSYLAPHQVGCGTPLGAEAVVHATRQVMDNSEITIKIDFKNAFNSISRVAILEEMKDKMPALYNYSLLSYGGQSHLFIRGQDMLSSSEGIQQGDPFGPFLFCISTHPMVSKLVSPFNEWYLDDGTLCGTLEETATDLNTLTIESSKLNLVLNPKKTEVLINNKVTTERKREIRSKLEEIGKGLSFLSREEATLLGAPITEEAILPSLTLKLNELKRLVSNLHLLDSHEALFLLKNCFAIPKLTHIMRSGACFLCPILEEFDSTLRHSLEYILNNSLEDNAWSQASLPVSRGGLGIRIPSSVALPAFLASCYASMDLVQRMLPVNVRAGSEFMLNLALAHWPLGQSPDHPFKNSQKAWDTLICNDVFDKLLINVAKPVDRARLLACQSPHANDWLNAIPVSQLGLKLNNDQLRISVGLLLGSPLCHPHSCICGAEVDKWGRHGLACNRNNGRYSRHVEANNLIQRALQSAKIPSILEPAGLERTDGKRPDGVTLSPWSTGRQAIWDFTCSDTLASSNVPKTSVSAGAAAKDAEQMKRKKYENLNKSYIMFPVAVETLGGWGPSGLSFIDSIGNLLIKNTGEARARSYLWQRLSVAVKRGNANAILSCVPSTKGLDEVFLLPNAKHEAGYGRHDRAGIAKLKEGGQHHEENADKHNHLTKEYVDDQGHDNGYNHRQHHKADGDHHHQVAKGGYGHNKGGPQIIYHSDNYYSPSDSVNNTFKSIIVEAPHRRRKSRRPSSSSRTLPLPGRGSVIPSEVSNVHNGDIDYKDTAPQAYPDRVNSKTSDPDDVVRSYVSAQKAAHVDENSRNPILDSLTPPSAVKDRFAFEVPKLDNNARVVFPEGSKQSQVALPAGYESSAPGGGSSNQLTTTTQARGPGVWYTGGPQSEILL